jgi:two-component system sensor histidine kinase YesM
MRRIWNQVTFGIQRKILFSVAFLLLLLFVAEIITLNLFISDILKKHWNESSKAINLQIIRSIDQNVNEMKLLASGISLDKSAIKVILDNFISEYDRVISFNNSYNLLESNQVIRQYYQLHLLSLKGHYMLSSTRQSQFTDDADYRGLLQQPWYTQLSRTASDIAVLPEFIDDKYFAVAVRIYTPDQAIAGYIIIACEKQYFHDLLQENLDSNLDVQIRSAQGDNVYTVENRKNRSSGNALLSDAKSVETAWDVRISMPDQVMKADLARLRRIIGIMIAVLTVLMLVILFYIIRRITRSLGELTRKMKMAENNSYDVYMSTNTNDEIGIVSNVFNRMIAETNRLINELIQTRVLAVEARMSSLQQQINPHYLYNTLGLISSMAAIHGVPRIQSVSEKLADLFRYNIDGDIYRSVTLQEELNHANNYLDIQKLLFGEQLAVKTDLDPELLDYPVIKFLIQPILENCFTHAFKNKEGLCRIRIRLYSSDIHDGVVIEIGDNGSGIEPYVLADLNDQLRVPPLQTMEKEAKHIGLKNVHRRIILRYGAPYGLEIDSTPGQGTWVRLVLPKKGGKGEHDGSQNHPNRTSR